MTQEFLVALGDEMRRARKHRGWTQRDLALRLPWTTSTKTLASYELGTRHMPVARFVDVADALGQPAADLLTRARRRITNDLGPGLTLDLNAVVEALPNTLVPLRRWARCRLHHLTTGQRPLVLISPPALTHLAKLCEIDTDDLIHQLTQPAAGLVHSGGAE